MGEQSKWLTFSSMLKGYRSDINMTTDELGKAIGYSQAYVSKVELGKRKPSVRFVENFVSKMKMEKSESRIWHRLGAEANGWKI